MDLITYSFEPSKLVAGICCFARLESWGMQEGLRMPGFISGFVVRVSGVGFGLRSGSRSSSGADAMSTSAG